MKESDERDQRWPITQVVEQNDVLGALENSFQNIHNVKGERSRMKKAHVDNLVSLVI